MGIKEYKHLGAYGLIIKDDKILLIKKHGGPYDGKLDLPGGTIEFLERPEDTLKRELREEVGIELNDYKLLDVDSVSFPWKFKDDILINVHHVGIFYMVTNYDKEIKKEIRVDLINDDSLGADFFNINELSRDKLSLISALELEKLGYVLKNWNGG